MVGFFGGLKFIETKLGGLGTAILLSFSRTWDTVSRPRWIQKLVTAEVSFKTIEVLPEARFDLQHKSFLLLSINGAYFC